jgi:hypothetical protein
MNFSEPPAIVSNTLPSSAGGPEYQPPDPAPPAFPDPAQPEPHGPAQPELPPLDPPPDSQPPAPSALGLPRG